MDDYIKDPHIPEFDPSLNIIETISVRDNLSHGACMATCDDHFPEDATEIDSEEFELFTELYVQAVMEE